MGILADKVFDKIPSLTAPWRRNSGPRGRRLFHGDVEKEEFQYASTHCLSSYYSVFVVRLAIMVMLAILIALLTVLTWHFTKIYTTKSLNTLAYGLRYELLQRPILRMWNVLNSTSEITTAQVKLSEYVLKRYDKPETQAEQVELYEAMKDVTWALFASSKALNAITVNYKNGFVQGFHRDQRAKTTFYIYSDLANYSITATGSNDINNISIHGNLSAIWYREPLDPITGEKIGKSMQIPPDDLINIAGFSQVPDGVASWHVAVSKFTDSPLLSAALPVRDASNENIVAVVGVTTELYSVGELMKELVEVHGGHIYLTTQEGYLLATSTNAPLLTNTTKGFKLMMAVDSEDHIIRTGARWLQNAYGNNIPRGHVVHVEDAEIDHKRHYIDSFSLNLKTLPMVGVVIIPRKFIMGKVDERAFKTLVILISASVCILVIGWVCILILTNGVSKEMKLRAELIRQLDARRRAEASSNYKSQFLANMSHELRTPMAAVIGLLDILICDDCLTNEQYATVTQIRKCSTALLSLLNNILDLSKVESGKLVLEDAEFDLGRELEGLVDMFSVQCINHNLEAVLDLSDDMPKLVRGDSARVVQIFANLISNSIKFTTSGHVILRGWCENLSSQKDAKSVITFEHKKARSNGYKQREHNFKRSSKKDNNKVVLWFEVDDTGSGIDPSKWESVFESFEQADPSTTRTHGGTGLGLCIVRTLVNKMGGEIKVAKKNGSGTLMQLYLVLSRPEDSSEQHLQVDFAKHSVVVLLALYGDTGRLNMSKWLRKNGVLTLEASEWNELTQSLRDLFQASSRNTTGLDAECSLDEPLKSEFVRIRDMRTPVFIIVVDITILDLSTDIWKEQLNFLDKFTGKAKFAWVLNHDTSNTMKMELRRKGHLLVVNKPLYKAKLNHVLKSVITEKELEMQKRNSSSLRITTKEGDSSHECLEIDSTQYDTCSSSSSSDDPDFVQTGGSTRKISQSNGKPPKKSLIELTKANSEEIDLCQKMLKLREISDAKSRYTKEASVSVEAPPFEKLKRREQDLIGRHRNDQGNLYSGKPGNGQKSLEGLRILLAEDTPVLQRVASIMLEKMGATVIAVGDGMQAVDALNYVLNAEEEQRWDGEISDSPMYDLILMDCQMPRMDGYEATKTIRRSEAGTRLHIPIVALTAHAMSCDEAKCLEVGMDAYLTKPIDYKLMVSTILQLTKRTS